MEPRHHEDFVAFVESRSPALMRSAYLLTGNRVDAEDLLQISLAKLYLAWPRVQSQISADAYVRRVLVNTRTSLWRRRRVRVCEYATDVVPERSGDDAFAGAELRSALMSVLAALPPRQRAVVVLRYYEDLSELEIADALGISVGTVKSTASRALASLRARAIAAGLHAGDLDSHPTPRS